jgi:hypothetical protein
VHETLLLKPAVSSGMAATSSVEVMWVQAVPWTHGILKSVIESKSKADPSIREPPYQRTQGREAAGTRTACRRPSRCGRTYLPLGGFLMSQHLVSALVVKSTRSRLREFAA